MSYNSNTRTAKALIYNFIFLVFICVIVVSWVSHLPQNEDDIQNNFSVYEEFDNNVYGICEGGLPRHKIYSNITCNFTLCYIGDCTNNILKDPPHYFVTWYNLNTSHNGIQRITITIDLLNPNKGYSISDYPSIISKSDIDIFYKCYGNFDGFWC